MRVLGRGERVVRDINKAMDDCAMRVGHNFEKGHSHLDIINPKVKLIRVHIYINLLLILAPLEFIHNIVPPLE